MKLACPSASDHGSVGSSFNGNDGISDVAGRRWCKSDEMEGLVLSGGEGMLGCGEDAIASIGVAVPEKLSGFCGSATDGD